MTQPTVNVNQWAELLAKTYQEERGEGAQETTSHDRVERAHEAATSAKEDKLEQEATSHHQDRIEPALEVQCQQTDTAEMAREAVRDQQSSSQQKDSLERAQEVTGDQEARGQHAQTCTADRDGMTDQPDARSVCFSEREEVEGELLYREREEVEGMDRTFHSLRPGRLNITELDPSLSLCFLCHTEQDFDNLCIGKTQAGLAYSIRLLNRYFLPLFIGRLKGLLQEYRLLLIYHI